MSLRRQPTSHRALLVWKNKLSNAALFVGLLGIFSLMLYSQVISPPTWEQSATCVTKETHPKNAGVNKSRKQKPAHQHECKPYSSKAFLAYWYVTRGTNIDFLIMFVFLQLTAMGYGGFLLYQGKQKLEVLR